MRQRHALVEFQTPGDAARAVAELTDANNWCAASSILLNKLTRRTCAELSAAVRRRHCSHVMLRQERGTQHRRVSARGVASRQAYMHLSAYGPCGSCNMRWSCSVAARCAALHCLRAACVGVVQHGRAATRACFGRRRSGLRVRHLLRSAAAGAARRGAPKTPPGSKGRLDPTRAQPHGQHPEAAVAACESAALLLAAAGDSGSAPGDQGAAAGEGPSGAAGAAAPPSRKAYVRRSKADYAAWAAATPASRAAASQPHKRSGEAGGGGGAPVAGGGAEGGAGGSAAAQAAPGDAPAAGTPGGKRRPCTCGGCCAARCARIRPCLVWSHGLPGLSQFAALSTQCALMQASSGHTHGRVAYYACHGERRLLGSYATMQGRPRAHLACRTARVASPRGGGGGWRRLSPARPAMPCRTPCSWETSKQWAEL